MKRKDIQYFQACFEKKDAPAQEGLRIKGYASTKTKDRYGDVVDPASFKNSIRTNYKKNPVILAYHDTTRPAGKAEVLKTDDEGLYIEALITDRGEIRQHVEDGVLKTFSIGYIPTKLEFRNKDNELLNPQTDDIWNKDVTRVIKALDLIEISIVSTPANPDALFTLEKSVKSFFDKAKEGEADLSQYHLTDKIMKSKNLLETKDEEVVETPESEQAETPVETQDGADNEEVETPSDEISAKEEGDETSTDDNSESDEGKTDVEDENKNVEIEIKGQKLTIPKSLISAKTIAELTLKVATLEAKLEAIPEQDILVFSEHSISTSKKENKEDEEESEEDKEEKKAQGFRETFKSLAR